MTGASGGVDAKVETATVPGTRFSLVAILLALESVDAGAGRTLAALRAAHR